VVEKMYVTDEMAESLRAKPPTVRKWVRRGILNPVRIGRRILFPESELQRVISEGRANNRSRRSKSMTEKNQIEKSGVDVDRKPRSFSSRPAS
jgi:excisionase family DNA binding protein